MDSCAAGHRLAAGGAGKDESVNIAMTGVGLTNALGGVYIGPYTVRDTTTGDMCSR